MTQTEQPEFILTITAENVFSTDSRFTMDDLYLGFNYKATDTYYKKANGKIIRRDRASGERGIGNRTMPRVAFQIFGQQISKLSKQEKYDFPICRWTPDKELIHGIYPDIDEFKRNQRSNPCLLE